MFDAREFRRSLAAFATGVAIVTSSSLAAFARAKYFAINVLTADQRELSQRFSSTVADKFDGVGAAYGGKKRQVAPWASLDKSRCKGETGRAEPCSRLRAGRVLF